MGISKQKFFVSKVIFAIVLLIVFGYAMYENAHESQRNVRDRAAFGQSSGEEAAIRSPLNPTHVGKSPVIWKRYIDDALGYSFAYPAGEEPFPSENVHPREYGTQLVDGKRVILSKAACDSGLYLSGASSQYEKVMENVQVSGHAATLYYGDWKSDSRDGTSWFKARVCNASNTACLIVYSAMFDEATYDATYADMKDFLSRIEIRPKTFDSITCYDDGARG